MSNILGPLPPYARLDNFLPEREHRRILEWVLSNPAEFSPALLTDGEIGSKYAVSPEDRLALTSKNLGPCEPMLRKHLLAALEEIVARLGMPLSPQSLDLEFSAYGNGAFFTPHIDISTGINREPLSGEVGQDRILSAVYYSIASRRRSRTGRCAFLALAPTRAARDWIRQITSTLNR